MHPVLAQVEGFMSAIPKPVNHADVNAHVGREAHALRLGRSDLLPGEPRGVLKRLDNVLTLQIRYPDAANAVPYELYDEATAGTKVDNAEALIAWLRQKIAS